MKSIWDVIKGPVITEKALTMKDEPSRLGAAGNDRQMLTLKVDRQAQPSRKSSALWSRYSA